jgi:Putative phage serine protease XkdF
MSDGAAVEDGFMKMLLSEVDVTAISMVKNGANGQRIFLRKSAESDEIPDDAVTVSTRIVKGAKSADSDWSAFYIVVAEPGRAEEPGIADGAGEPIRDVWASEDEIRKAAHRFMHNGALINKMHEDLAPYGQLVENAVALADIQIDTDQVIKKGSWYIAVEPTPAGREAVEKGEFTGVSIQGSGLRTPANADEASLLTKPRIAKGSESYFNDYDRDLLADLLLVPIAKAGSSASLPDLDWSAAENWIDRLPEAMGAAFKRSWIYRAAKHLTYEVYGGNRGHAFAVAIEAARKGCATGDLNWPGDQSVNPVSRAEMCAAVSLWEAMKAATSHKQLTKEGQEAVANQAAIDAGVDPRQVSAFRRLGEFLGVIEPQSGDLAKEAGTVDPVSESTDTGAEKTVEQRIEALEGQVGTIAKSIEPLAKLPEEIAKLTESLPEKKEDEPDQAQLEKKLEEQEQETEKLRDDIAKLAEGSPTEQPGDTPTLTKEELAKASSGGDGWEALAL